MPQIVFAAMAKTAVAAPAVAATVAPAAAGIGTAAAQTATLEALKQKAIQEGMKQVGTEAVKQAGVEATKQAGVEAAKQAGVEATKQAAGRGIDQGAQEYLRSSTASLNPTAPSQFLPPKAPAGDLMSQINNMNPASFADDIAASQSGIVQGASGSSYVPPGSTPIPSYATPAAPVPPVGSPMPPFKPVGSGPLAPELTQSFMPANPPAAKPPFATKPYTDPGTFSRVMSSEPSMSKLMTSPVDELAGLKPAEFPLAPKSALRQGAEDALKWMGDNKLETGMLAMTAGQYMNKPEEEDKDKYKSTVDMSEFKTSAPSVVSFTPSYEHQSYAAEGGLMGYAVGGPIETMSAQNAVGANMKYPMAGLSTPLYSNPTIQRPEAFNVISPSAEPAVGAYSGEPKFAEGGISDEMAREYGLKSRKQRAAKSLTQSYEDMEAARNREAAALASSVNINSESNPKIVRRSRTQELSSPYSAAIEEHNRLAKKTKTQQFQQPKTSLGDIDNYMDVPVELAASGGIMGNLGGYSDGGRLLRGPGDGVSDSIPAVIGKRQPARLADGEFVIPARIVSELGNGSTEAGARKLYAMMERIQSTRKKSIGKKKVAVNSRADKHLPA